MAATAVLGREPAPTGADGSPCTTAKGLRGCAPGQRNPLYWHRRETPLFLITAINRVWVLMLTIGRWRGGSGKAEQKAAALQVKQRSAVTPPPPTLSFFGELHVRCQPPEHHLPFSLPKYLLKIPEFSSPQLHDFQQLTKHRNCFRLHFKVTKPAFSYMAERAKEFGTSKCK